MNIQVDIHKMLLEAVLADPAIKAALVVDAQGSIVERLGSAMSLRQAGEEDATETMTTDLENVYIKTYGENFVIVLFDEKKSFERIKASVDDQVDRVLTAI